MFMTSEYLTGYFKNCGHIVLEKAALKGNNVLYTVCGDLDEMADDAGMPLLGGRSKGELASGFQQKILSGISKYGEDHIFSLTKKTFYGSDGNAIAGPDMKFGSGCAGIVAAGSNAYVWVTEKSGMCVIRIAEVFGKAGAVKSLSSEIGGDALIGLTSESVLIICPEDWADMQMRPDRKKDNAFLTLMNVFKAGEIRDDAFFDKVLGEITDEAFKGCMAALAVKGLN